MEFLLQNFPQESIVFFRRVLFLALATGLLVVLPLSYHLLSCWNSEDGWDQKVKWWIVLRLTAFCTQMPIRWAILKQLAVAENAPDLPAMRRILIEMTQSNFWTFSQHISIFLCSWLIISFLACIVILPETKLTLTMWWICWWTVALIAFHLFCAIYMLHRMLADDLGQFSSVYGGIDSQQLDKYSDVITKTENDDFIDCQCDICFCEYESGNAIRQFHTCKHHYHKLCLDPWMAKSESGRKCPLCQQRVDVKPKVSEPANESKEKVE